MKIKDSVDLKELKKFEFRKSKYSYFKNTNNVYIEIPLKSREINALKYPLDTINLPLLKDLDLMEHIKDLIAANLVEE